MENFYEYKHVNSGLLVVNFTNLMDEEFYAELLKEYETPLRNYYDARKDRVIAVEHDLYTKNAELRDLERLE